MANSINPLNLQGGVPPCMGLVLSLHWITFFVRLEVRPDVF